MGKKSDMAKVKKESTFKVFDSEGKSGKGSLYNVRSNIPLVHIGDNLGSISPCAQNKIGVTKKDRVVISIKDDDYFIAIIPLESKIIGYKIFIAKGGLSFGFSSKSSVERGVQIGYYKVLDPIYKNEIDWFKLELWEING